MVVVVYVVVGGGYVVDVNCDVIVGGVDVGVGVGGVGMNGVAGIDVVVVVGDGGGVAGVVGVVRVCV